MTVGIISSIRGKRAGKDVGARKKRPSFTPPPSHVSLRPCLTLTVQYRSQCEGIGQLLADRLGFTLYDKEIFDLIAEQSNVPRDTIDALDEDSTLGFNFLVNSLLGSPYVVPEDFGRDLVKALHMIAETGDTIILGRGSALALRGPKVLNVRILESFESRLKRLQDAEGISYTEAEIEIAEIDSARSQFIEDYYKHDIDDPELYDLVVNCEFLTRADVADLIQFALKAKLGAN